MYKAMSKHIIEETQKGYVLMPTEGEVTLLNKVAFKNFLAIDYRYSNNVLVSGDAQSIVAPYEPNQTHDSNYVMGFAVVRKPAQMSEFAQSTRATTTRVRKKIVETLAEVLSDVRIPQNRGRRSVFIETERKDGFVDIEEVMKSVGLDPTKNPKDEYLVLPFFVSTSVFFNNFRAKVGVGNSANVTTLIKDDVMRRLPKAFAEVEEKLNRRLATPITSSLFVSIVLASPAHIADDSVFKTSLLDYAQENAVVNAPVATVPTTQSAPAPSLHLSYPFMINQPAPTPTPQKQTPAPSSASLPKPTNKGGKVADFTVDPVTGEIVWK